MKKEFIKILFLRTMGHFLVLSAFFLIAKTFYEPIKQEIRYFVESRVGKRYLVQPKTSDIVKPQKHFLASLLKIPLLEILTPEDPNFSVVIPKIGANARVFPNVNSADEKEYLAFLRRGVAHAAGTAFPGERSHIFLFAHSTDYFWNVGNYNAIFYLLYKLEVGDEVNLFYQGQRVIYSVVGKRIVEADEVEYLTRKTNEEFLTLQTCWPPGTTLKRLLIFATRKSV